MILRNVIKDLFYEKMSQCDSFPFSMYVQIDISAYLCFLQPSVIFTHFQAISSISINMSVQDNVPTYL